jgi:hypothetical protein
MGMGTRMRTRGKKFELRKADVLVLAVRSVRLSFLFLHGLSHVTMVKLPLRWSGSYKK